MAILEGIEAEGYDRQYSDKELYRRMMGYFRPYRRRWLIVIGSLLAQAVLQALPPMLTAEGVERIAATQNWSSVIELAVTILIIGVAVWLFNWWKRVNEVRVVEGVVVQMRHDAFAAAVRQDMGFYDTVSSGRAVSRITSDTNEFGRIINLVAELAQNLLTAIILFIYLMRIEWRLNMIILIFAPLIVWVSLYFRQQARNTTRQSSRALAEVNHSIQEAVTGIAIAKNFRQEQKIFDEFTHVNTEAYRINLRRAFVVAMVFPTMASMLGLVTGALVYFGGLAVFAQLITLSSWYLFMATVDRFWFPIINMSSFWSQFQQGLSAAERIFALIDSEPSVRQSADLPVPPLRGEIEFRHLTFGYYPTRPVLTDFSVRIPAGHSFALVGHTGSGKSSIIKLLARFYEYQTGEILLDGLSLRDLNLPQYRQQLGIVNQVPFLFAGTVAENMRYGRPMASDEEILAMARRIGQGDWLHTLADGLQTEVGERGTLLSMGQRQLIVLTRVLLADPRIFILDEATANIDPFTEAQIQEALRLIMRDRTSIIIAHRLSTIKSADTILVLQQGRIIEQGNHSQLLAQAGHYAELYDTYFRHQSLDYINQQGWKKRS